MAGYVDGFLLPVPKKKLAAYKKMAALGAKMWMEHGALEYYECVGDDLFPKGVMPFPKQLKLKPGETVIFAFVRYKNRAHRDRVNKKVFSDPRMQPMGQTMPFDMKRMCFGGFDVLVEG
jgi:uncharacterized protein YbaA (DUF1428 family)